MQLRGGRGCGEVCDPAQVPPLEVRDGPAVDRKYGSGEQLPWQENVTSIESRVEGAFYDNVTGVLRRGEEMVVTPQSVRENIRVLSLIRKGTAFPGRVSKSRVGAAVEAPTSS